MIVKTANTPTKDTGFAPKGSLALDFCRASNEVYFIDVWGGEKGLSLRVEGEKKASTLWGELVNSQNLSASDLISKGFEEL